MAAQRTNTIANFLEYCHTNLHSTCALEVPDRSGVLGCVTRTGCAVPYHAVLPQAGRAAKLEQLNALKARSAEVTSQLAAYRESDPETVEAMRERGRGGPGVGRGLVREGKGRGRLSRPCWVP